MKLQKMKNWTHPALAMLCTGLVAALLMLFYLGGEIRGNFNWSILPSAEYEIPDAEIAHGFEPLYIHRGKSGWDGQFYYYISNDLLAQTDAKYKVEMAPYRYQRIGVPLLAKSLSIILGQDFVTVPIFYATSVLLVLLATLLFARFLQSRGYSPYLSLLWSLATGTQITMMNGLPDAGADALLLMAFVALFEQKIWLYALAMGLAVLSREIYILFAGFIGLFTLLDLRKSFFTRQAMQRLFVLSLPLLIFIGWQIYLKIHFANVAPINLFKQQLLSPWPVITWAQILWPTLLGNHPIFAATWPAWIEAKDLISSFALLVTALFIVFQFIKIRMKEKVLGNPIEFGIFVAFAFVFVSYLFLGHTVWVHHTGYLKVISLCLPAIILSYLFQQKLITQRLVIALAAIVFIIDVTSITRVLESPSTQEQYSQFFDRKNKAENLPRFADCVSNIKASIEPAEKKSFSRNEWFQHISNRPEIYEMMFKVKNLGATPLPATLSFGTTLLVYGWYDEESKTYVVETSWPSRLQTALASGEERQMPIVIRVPKSNDKMVLRLSLMQLACPGSLANASPDNLLMLPWPPELKAQ